MVLGTSAITRQEYAAGYVSALKLASGRFKTRAALAMAEPFEIEKRRLDMILRNAIPRLSARWAGALLVVAAVGLPTFAGLSAEGEDLRIETILGYQRQYFARIQSLEFTARSDSTMHETIQERAGLPGTRSDELKFVHSPAGYYTEVNLDHYDHHGDKRRHTRILAYNGQLYQTLSFDENQKTRLLIVTRDTPEPLMYATVHPLLTPFDFTLRAGDKQSLPALRSPAIWRKLAAAVTEVSDASMLGHDGVKFKIVGSTPGGIEDVEYEVFFAADLGYYPVHTRVILPDAVVSEYQVLASRSYRLQRGRMMVPTRAQVRTYFADGTVAQESIERIVPASVRINQSVDETGFTIPLAQVDKYLDADIDKILDVDRNTWMDMDLRRARPEGS